MSAGGLRGPSGRGGSEIQLGSHTSSADVASEAVKGGYLARCLGASMPTDREWSLAPDCAPMDRDYYMAYVCGGHHWWDERIGVGFSAMGWLQRRGDTCRLRGGAA